MLSEFNDMHFQMHMDLKVMLHLFVSKLQHTLIFNCAGRQLERKIVFL